MEDLPILTGSATVILVVNGLPITIQLDGNNAPITAGNFADLVERDFYDGISFHRVVREPDPFVVQAGDPNSLDPNFPPEQLGSGGFIDPATGEERNIPLEILPQGAAEPILGQTFEQAEITVPPVLQNTRGTIAMARVASDPNSASSQFFINLSDSDFLDGDFAVFGTVIQGLEGVVDGIQQGDRIADAEVVDGIIESRESSLIEDPLLLNGFINQINLSSLPLEFLVTRDFDAANSVTLTSDLFIQAPAGIFVGGGNDQVIGSEGTDVVNGNQGDDNITGAAGDDYLFGGQGNDVINGGEGNDIVSGSRGNDTISGGAGNDWIRGREDNDILNGDNGDDYLIGDEGIDILTGGLGADTFVLNADESLGVQDVNLVDTIVDLNAAESDRIFIISTQPINVAELSFNLVGSNTEIQRSNGDILGVVQNAQPDVVQSAIVFGSTADLALTIG